MSVDTKALKATQDKGVTVGVVPPGGRTALRLEIDDFLKDTELANLYFLALEALQAESNPKSKGYKPDSKFSYYEIAGIHGQPDRAWDGVTQDDTPGVEGYCAHGRPTFPTWHRVYLMQYEQALYLKAAELAPDLGAQSVLDRFRIPYLDPFLPRLLQPGGSVKYGLPVIMVLPRILVKRKINGPWVPIDNPLYRFAIHSKPGDVIDIGPTVGGEKSTVRGEGSSFNHETALERIHTDYGPPVRSGGSRSSAAQSLWRSLLDRTGKDWLNMSNRFSLVQGVRASIESFHDNLHVVLRGSMSSGAHAGFDPAFWLHHCNVDRVLAIWQGLRSKDGPATAWWDRSEALPGPADGLFPFRKSRSDSRTVFWTSNDVANHRTLGYDYPETAKALQSGDVVASLTTWANTTLGRLVSDPIPLNQAPLAALRNSVQHKIPFWPSVVAFDGRTPLSRSNYSYMGSNPTPPAGAPKGPPKFAMMAAATPAEGASKPIPAAKLEPEGPFNVEAVQKAIVKLSIPEDKHTMEDRCGGDHEIISDQKMTQWEVCFTVDKFALNGSFAVVFFLGDFNGDKSTWGREHNIAGASYVFASNRERVESGSCGNCKSQADDGFKYGDAVSITQPLLTYYQSKEVTHDRRLTSLHPDVVVPFLYRELHWRILDANGDEVPRENLESLKIGVYSETVYMPEVVTQPPTFEDRVLQYDVTAGRPNGMNPGDSWA